MSENNSVFVGQNLSLIHIYIKYNDILVPACAEKGIVAFTGDGVDPAVMTAATEAIKKNGGRGIPTVKPWDEKTLSEKLAEVKNSGAFAVAMDVDAAGLPFLQGRTPVSYTHLYCKMEVNS